METCAPGGGSRVGGNAHRPAQNDEQGSKSADGPSSYIQRSDAAGATRAFQDNPRASKSKDAGRSAHASHCLPFNMKIMRPMSREPLCLWARSLRRGGRRLRVCAAPTQR